MVRNWRAAPWRQTEEPWPAVRTEAEANGQDRFGAPSLLQLISERRRRLGLPRVWNQNQVGPVVPASYENGNQYAGPANERSKTERVSSPAQEFAIDPKSIRFVAEDGAYAISGNVTGPCGGQARIRVWLGDPDKGGKRRDPILGSETLVSANLVVDLPGGNNVFSIVLEEFQLPANIPLPPGSADPWVLTASAIWGEAESEPVLLSPPEQTCREIVASTELSVEQESFEIDSLEAAQRPTIKDPPPNGANVRSATTYEIKGVQARSFSPLLIEARPVADGERVPSTSSFATILDPGETEFSILVKLECEGPNSFVMRVTDLGSGAESALVAVPKITRRQNPRVDTISRYKKQYT
jgi:hypothetical protein